MKHIIFTSFLQVKEKRKKKKENRKEKRKEKEKISENLDLAKRFLI